MRAVVMLALAAGCGFETSAATGDDTPIDAAVIGNADAAPDAFVPLPACMTSAAYSNGPEIGHRYRKIAPKDRDGAVDACNADGAHLAVIDNAAEDSYVHTFAGTTNTYIGLDDLTTEGTFRWVTNQALGYEHFEGQEPNNNNVEDCVVINGGDGTWNDVNCGVVTPAVCECEVAYTPRPTPACRAMTGTVHSGRKYLLRRDGAAKSWPAAKTECEAVGGHLPVFADRDEEGPVNSDFPAENWLGLSDAAAEGKFVWVDGTTPTTAQTHWTPLSPHTNDTVRNCVRIYNDWEDKACTEVKEYACECEP